MKTLRRRPTPVDDLKDRAEQVARANAAKNRDRPRSKALCTSRKKLIKRARRAWRERLARRAEP